ncbi:glycosyltransferase family 2 protein [Zavarzinella formosa]|uniref:glycosyltransferase family 2 protein n=1 Tax=Zavarzinella formosa TaxID=360055 RepID=UPI0002F91CAC|nr:glycosyltransferase family 2 protein [Zavarzinella formosa]
MSDALSATVAVVIVNYRTPSLTIDCLRTLVPERERLPGLRAIVVENASGDDSYAVLAEAIRREGWDWAELLTATKNNGFAAGNNVALRTLASTSVDYIWLLNPDTLLEPGAAVSLAEFLNARPHVGIAGSHLLNIDGSFQTSAYRFPSAVADFENWVRLGFVSKALEYFRVSMKQSEVPHRADWVSGASLMLRREVLDAIGLMDEGFFLYFEETEYCQRARMTGWDIWHVPDSRVTHIAGQSTGITGDHTAPKRRPKYWFDSRSRYFEKCNGRTRAMLADAAFLTAFSLWKLQRAIRRKPDPDPPHFWGDFARYSLRRWT